MVIRAILFIRFLFKIFTVNIFIRLEMLFRFKSKHESKAGCTLKRTILDSVQANTIIKSKQTEHRQEESHTYTHTSAKTEWIIIPVVVPAICCFKECQTIDCTAWIRS